MSVLTDCVGVMPGVRPAVRARANVLTAVLAGLLICVLVVSFSRCLFYPLGQDQAFYQYVTKMTMDGHRESVAREVKFYSAFVVMQWAAIKCFGYTETGFHAFDICWQLLTVAALVALFARERRWTSGLLAGTLYAFVYYGLNYQVINGRDACAVLPMLLMLHALIPLRRAGGDLRPLGLCALAGTMGFAFYMLKLTLGMAFGLAWLYLLVEACGALRCPANARSHKRRFRGFAELAAFSAGFLGGAAAWAALMLAAGWWDDLSPLYSAFPPKGYNTGHWQMLALLPRVAIGSTIVAGVLAAVCIPRLIACPDRKLRRQAFGEFAWLAVGGAVVFGLVVTAQSWFEWSKMLLVIGGVFVPMVGGMVAVPWRERSFAWRMCLLMAGASLLSLFLQANFWVYHFIPLVLFAAYLSAEEIARVFSGIRGGEASYSGWAVVCTAALVSLPVMVWWPRMTAQATCLNVLAATTRDEYHARVASHINHVPEYPTAIKVAAKVRQITRPGEPIACLLLDTRIYYYADRPMAHGLAFIFCRGWEQWYPDYMRSVREKRPKAVMARIPLGYSGPRDAASIQPVIFDDLEAKFGPCASVIRELYHVSDVIDDVVVLTCVEPQA